MIQPRPQPPGTRSTVQGTRVRSHQKCMSCRSTSAISNFGMVRYRRSQAVEAVGQWPASLATCLSPCRTKLMLETWPEWLGHGPGAMLSDIHCAFYRLLGAAQISSMAVQRLWRDDIGSCPQNTQAQIRETTAGANVVNAACRAKRPCHATLTLPA